jgi:hypothetical protein
MAPLASVAYHAALAVTSWGRNRLDVFGLGTDHGMYVRHRYRLVTFVLYQRARLLS